jgi:hypothetical protein
MDPSNPFQVIEAPCCSPAPAASESLHEELKQLLSQYDINAAAASVKVYAVKPGITPKKDCCGTACCSGG